jgi:hypothetical protein
MGNFVMAVIDDNSIAMLKDIREKGKLVERPGRKTANLSFLDKGGYGSRVAMEMNHISDVHTPGKKHTVRRFLWNIKDLLQQETESFAPS